MYEDAEILFEDNFDDNTYAADFLSTFTGDLDIFSDGMLKCYRPAELFNYSPMELDYDSYFQYEFWADVSAWNETNEAKPGTGSWMGVMLGVRVNNPSLNPTSDDGYWVSFSQGDKVLFILPAVLPKVSGLLANSRLMWVYASTNHIQ